MPMKNPPHPGLLVRDSLEELGLSVQAAAVGMGVTRQQLHRVISGVSGVTPEMAVRLEKAIGSNASAWLAMQAAHDLSRAREAIGEIPRLTAKVTDLPRP